MRIDVVRCDEETELHIWSRHRITSKEVSEAAERKGFLGGGVARLITARDMNWTERRRYERHMMH